MMHIQRWRVPVMRHAREEKPLRKEVTSFSSRWRAQVCADGHIVYITQDEVRQPTQNSLERAM